MEEYYIIKMWMVSEWVYFTSCNDSDMFTNRPWHSIDPYIASKFTTESLAEHQLIEGRTKFHWGGIFQIEKIYISR